MGSAHEAARRIFRRKSRTGSNCQSSLSADTSPRVSARSILPVSSETGQDMFPLMRLPVELILRVIDAVYPGDLDALGMCSKTMRAIAEEALARHRERRAKYSVFIFEDGWGHYSYSLFEKLVQTRDLAYYPRTVQIGTHKSACGGVISSNIFSKVFDLVRRVAIFQDWEKKEWLGALLDRGSQSAPIALLFLFLPNLRSVCFDSFLYCDMWMRPPYTMFERILGSSGSTERTPCKTEEALSRFQEVMIKCVWPEHPGFITNSIQLYAPFAFLPCMRSLRGERINGRSDGWRETAFSQKLRSARTSKITKINFTHSAVDAKSFDVLIGGIPALREFRYHHFSHDEEFLPSYQPMGIVKALRRYTFKSPEVLELTAGQYMTEEDHRIGSLRMFRVLRDVRLDDELLKKRVAFPFNRILSRMERLVDVLPKTTTTLRLIQRTHDKDAIDLFLDIAEWKEERLPQLKEVVYNKRELPATSLSKGIRENLAKIGIVTSDDV